jgi:serine/threonine-protein kinase
MKPERWQQIDDLLQSALARAPGERSAFLAQACGRDEPLRHEVESLIASHEHAGSLLDTPMSQIAAELLVKDQPGFVAGQKIGPYQIVDSLGAGGMGEVYLAEDPRLGRKIALKLLPGYFTKDANRLRRFEQEARAASSLNHPNIVTIYEIGEADGHHFIASEFIDGMTLRERIAASRIAPDGGPFTSTELKLSETLDLAVQIGEALAAAHAAGIVHRDIKPENIMVRHDAYVKVLDFGLAKLTERPSFAIDTEGATPAPLKTNPGIVMGTVTYMSPEQARGLPVDARTDIWSLGVVLYEMVTGLVPFEGETATDVILSIVEREPSPLARYSKGVPAELDRIVSKALRKNREERYQTAKDLALDLKNLKQELEVQARLERSIESGAIRGEKTSRSSEQMANAPGPQSAARTVDVGMPHPTSNIEYLISEIKHHKRTATLAAVCVTLALAVLGYYFYFAKGGEAIDSIAVLPFVNVSNDPNTEYLSDGLSDSIINSLSQLPNLKKVISLNSVLRYKGKQPDPQAVGRELNVGAVLTGRLTLRGDEVLVSTELVDVKNNKRLWGGKYSHKLADVFKLQGEIAQDISERLRLKLTGEQKERLTKSDTENAEAYQLYLQGLYYWWKNTDEATLKSGEYFRQAIGKDPNFALAYVGLAQYYNVMANFGNMRPNEAWPKAEEALVKALAIDDRLAEAHQFLGAVKMCYDWDWPGAEQEFRRANELEPEGDRGLYNRLLEAMGRIDEAIADASVDWNQPPGSRLDREERLPKLLSLAGRYNEAIEGWRKILEKEPNRRGMAHLAIGEIYVKQGRYEEALAEMIEVRPRIRYPRELARIGYVYAAAGKRDEAIKILEEMKGLTGKRYNLSTHIAAIYAALGNKDEALAWLKRACDEHEQGVVGFKVDPRFDTLRSDPRFMDLLRRVKLAP